MPHEFVRPFHFWCQKVLPLVFDDSLSYYEVLAKMRDYLNTTINEINGIGSEFEGVKQQLTQLQTYVDEYFAGLDVNQAISDKLDNMVESGEMDAIITPIFAAYANPLFAASVADMVATNFAYANYENNKIYTYNQSTGLYQTTGKEFGGVVSSVDEMGDNYKYYALDSDGMLYDYDFPEGAFTASGLTYGGYRYGVNAMRPISNVYVLTTDSHVYTWNGSEYVDTGVVYGLNNTAFVWRRELSSADNVTLLITDGWYYFKSDNLPNGLPVNMETSDGFAVVYSIPNGTEDSDNLQSETAQDVQTQKTQTIRADSRNKRIVLQTAIGGSWFWNGYEWIPNNQIGFPVCENPDVINWNSVIECNENTPGLPTENKGILKTITINESKSQLFFSGDNLWFRINNGEWIRCVKNQEQENNERKINSAFEAINALSFEQYKIRTDITNQIDRFYYNNEYLLKLLITSSKSNIITENGTLLVTNNNQFIQGEIPVAKTDKDLDKENEAADSKAVGISIAKLHEINALLYASISEETNARIESDEALRIFVVSLLNNTMEIVGNNITTESNNNITSENNNTLQGERYGVKTNKELNAPNEPADSYAVGKAIKDALNATRDSILEERELRTKNDNEINNSIETKLKNTITIIEFRLLAENDNELISENSEYIQAELFGTKTDYLLVNDALPANAKATGQRLESLESLTDIWKLRRMSGGFISDYFLPTIELFGTLPTTKSKVNMRCRISTDRTVYDGNCKIKVQGNSSTQHPEKNYTLTTDNKILIGNWNLKKWNLKCNYIDTTQIRNLVCAKLWAQCMQEILPDVDGYISTNNANIICENNDKIKTTRWNTHRIMRGFNNGATDGVVGIVIVNNNFHGLYTIQIPKDDILNMPLSAGQWFISSNSGHMQPCDTQSDFYEKYEIEEKNEDVSEEIIYEKTNEFFNAVYNATDDIDDVINSYGNLDIYLAYVCHALYTDNTDGIYKNFLLYTYDNGNHINISAWDMDVSFGNQWKTNLWQTTISRAGLDFEYARKIMQYKPQLLKEMWSRLRATVLNKLNVLNLCRSLLTPVNSMLFALDSAKWNKGKTMFATPYDIMNWLNLSETFHDEYVSNI